jgi:hypothetical protein
MIDSNQPDRSGLLYQNTTLATAFSQIGIEYTAVDFSEQTYCHLQRKHQLGLEMNTDFEAENHLALWKNIMAESESSPRPYDPGTCNMARYLYHARLS